MLTCPVQVIDDDKKFAVSLNVSHFRPEDLKVHLDGRELTVEGKQEHKGENSYIHRGDVEQALGPLREAVSRGNFDSAGNLVEVMDDDYKLAISMNVAQFTPKELSVDVDGRVLTIEGKQENEESNGSFMRSFVRQWTLPDDVDADQLKCTITEDGYLAVEAPKIVPPILESA
ncbi:unnamed protein product [Cylicocyclus nassatus]|uniref:SHSP domain-containing protein n=1 Tax=Cylicocyclus nassatus TaxID=53992 RepID=A0AA36GCM4_CYLNA|nr:unnamed protein product [Cylicocyclus nassatus]